MSGDQGDLVQNCFPGISGNILPPFKRAVEFCLGNQFVVMKAGSKDAFKVSRGSGMGLIASDELSNLDFYACAEQKFVLRPGVMLKYGITLYLRYKDDILVGLDCDESLRHKFLAELELFSKWYKLKVDESSYSSVVMLDVVISKVDLGL